MEAPVMSPARSTPDESTYSGRIGKRIRGLREAKKLSLREVVDHLNQLDIHVTIAGFSHWEVGRRQVDLNALPAIADCLGVSIAKLFPPE